jgi:hypothetical protein
MIPTNVIVYAIVTAIAIFFLVKDLLSDYSGGSIAQFKKDKGELGIPGGLTIVLWIIISAIWGGIFWW